jgi:lysophospholipase L1-like esterase
MKALALGAVIGLLAGCAIPSTLPAGSHYAALGSSYAAGAGIPPLASDRPARCGASQASYSRLLAERLELTLTDASCGGATTAHVLGPWDELPPQVEAVRRDTRLVTVTIGGNDLNYMGMMFAASCHAGMRDPRLIDPATGECRQPVLPETAAVQAVENNLAALLAAIRARAPQARVVLVQYVSLAGEHDCPAAPLAPEHAAIARQLAAMLATASERAAQRAGAEVLPVDQLSASHTPCDAEPWARGLGEGFDRSQGAPWHPSAAGHAAIARMLEEMLR